MSVIFADTFYFLGLLNPDDHPHQRCVQFASQYQKAELLVAALDVERTYRRKVGNAEVTFVGLRSLVERLA